MSFETPSKREAEAEGNEANVETAEILTGLAERASDLVDVRLRKLVAEDGIPVAVAVSRIAQEIRHCIFTDGSKLLGISDAEREAGRARYFSSEGE